MNPSISEQFRQRAGLIDFPDHIDEIKPGEEPELLEVKNDREEREREAALQQAKVDAAEKFRSDEEKSAEKKAPAKKTGK